MSTLFEVFSEVAVSEDGAVFSSLLAYSICSLNCIPQCLYLGWIFELLVIEMSTFRFGGEMRPLKSWDDWYR